MRRTLALCLVCLSYVVFGSVLWAAYHDFGKQSLLDRDHPAIAEGMPGEAVPGGLLPRDVSQAPGPPTASRAGEAAAARHDVSSSAAGQIPSLVDVDRSRTAPQRAEGAVAQMPATAATGFAPATNALEDATGRQPEQDVAPPSEPWSAALTESPVEQAGASPPKPVLKPLEAIPAANDPGSEPDEPIDPQRLDVQRVGPPTPSLKPIVMPGNREPGRWHDTDQATAAAGTLPDAVRAWWSNLKILLASGPVVSGRPAGGDDSDGGAQGTGSGTAASSGSNDTGSTGGANNGARGGGGTTGGGATDHGGGTGNSSGTGGGSSPGAGSASGGGTAERGGGDAGSTSAGGGGAPGATGGGRDSRGGERGGQGGGNGNGGGKGGDNGKGGGKGGDNGKGGGKGGGDGKGGGKGKD